MICETHGTQHTLTCLWCAKDRMSRYGSELEADHIVTQSLVSMMRAVGEQMRAKTEHDILCGCVDGRCVWHRATCACGRERIGPVGSFPYCQCGSGIPA